MSSISVPLDKMKADQGLHSMLGDAARMYSSDENVVHKSPRPVREDALIETLTTSNFDRRHCDLGPTPA